MDTAKRAVISVLLLGMSAAAPVPASAAGLKLDMHPHSLSFGKVQVDATSPPKTLTLSNPNSTALGITSITPVDLLQ